MGWFKTLIKLYKKAQLEMTDSEQEVVPQDSGLAVQQPVQQPVQQGVDQFGAESIETTHSGIQTTLVAWKGGKRYYLQLSGVPADPIDPFMNSFGYKFNKKFGSWSKEINLNNASEIEIELDTIENNFKVPVFRDALQDIQMIFNLGDETIKTEEASKIQKLKETKMDEKEKYKIAEEYVHKSLEKIIENIDTPETQAFIDALTSLNNKFYRYSFLNSFLIAWQNGYIDPKTGKMIRRSGRVASKDKWKKEFGREVKLEETMKGSDVFVPRISTIKSSGVSVLLGAIRSFIGMVGDGDFDKNIGGLYGFLKKKMPAAKKKWERGMISIGLYTFFKDEIMMNRHNFKTIGDVYRHFSEKQKEGNAGKKNIVKEVLTGFKMGPVYDMDQTDVIPGQEDKDPKVQIEAVEQQWLGRNNTDTERTLSLRDLAIKAASVGKMIKNQNITVGLNKETGESGGWSKGGEIELSGRIAGERQLFTLMHELAHSVLHFKDQKRKFTRVEAEVDAEGAAYVIMGHYGFSDNQRAYNYLANWTQKHSDQKDFIRNRFQPILEAANAIISGIEHQKMEDYGGSITACSWYKRIVYANQYKQLLKKLQISEEYIMKKNNHEKKIKY